MSTTHFQPIYKKLEEQHRELEEMFAQAAQKQKADNAEKATRAAYVSLYEGNDAPLTRFTTMKVNPGNAKVMHHAFKLMETFSNVPASEFEEIRAKGAEKGFTEGDTMFLYNLARYSKALDNMRSQKERMIEYIIAEA